MYLRYYVFNIYKFRHYAFFSKMKALIYPRYHNYGLPLADKLLIALP